MKKNLMFAVALIFISCVLFLNLGYAKKNPETQKDKASYSIGWDIGNNLKRQSIDIDADIMLAGIKDALSGSKPLLTDDERKQVMMSFQKDLQDKQMKVRSETGEKNKKAGEEFLAKNKQKEGVKITSSGLQYKIIKQGTGDKPKSNDTVTVNYEGRLIDGTVFDSSYFAVKSDVAVSTTATNAKFPLVWKNETSNPILESVGETSLIFNEEKNQFNLWIATGSLYDNLCYYSATDYAGIDYEPYVGNPILRNIRFPYVLKNGGTYYVFTSTINATVISMDIYLWKSTDAVTFGMMNNGSAVLTRSTDTVSIWKYIWNPGVCMIGNTFYMLVECSTEPAQNNVGVGYSWATLNNLNFNTNRTNQHIIEDSFNTELVYIPDRNAFVAINAQKQDENIVIGADYAYLSDNLSLPASWKSCPGFPVIQESGIVISDPSFTITKWKKKYNIVLSYLYNQRDNYQTYLNVSLDEFFDLIISPIRYER